MDTFKIEKGVPLPSKVKQSPTHVKYPFDKMELGDSFAFDPEKIAITAVRSAAHIYSKRRGKKFSIRLVGKGARVWRIG